MFSEFLRPRSNLKNLVVLFNPHLNISLISRRFKMEDLKSNPFFDKYADKIAALQQESPEELKKKLEENEKRKNKKNLVKVEERPYSVASNSKSQLDSISVKKTKKLNEIMKVELLKDKSGEEIERLWIDYHKDKDKIVSVIPKKTYTVMHERGKKYPIFLFPIPRSQGYEFIMCQYADYEVHFTPLIAYQTYKENAPECLTLTFFCDLVEDKGVVLMKGEFDTNILNCQEAQCLVNEFQLYYAQNHEKKLKLLNEFTHNSSNFNHMDLIKEIETLSL